MYDRGDEYKPTNSDFVADSTDESGHEHNSDRKIHIPLQPSHLESTYECDDESNCSDIMQDQALNEPSSIQPVTPKMTVMLSTKDQNGRRKWDKKHCCKFCMKMVAKLPRHFEQKHGDELEVVRIFSLPKHSTERKANLRQLMNDGDYLHNKQVLSQQNGFVIPFKRPKEIDQRNVSDYIPCSQCLGLFLRYDLWRHAKRCPKRHSVSKEKHVRHEAASALIYQPDMSKNKSFKKKHMKYHSKR